MNKISVFVAEGENHVRQAIQLSLEHLDGIQVSGNASSAESLLAQLGQGPPDVLLLDWLLPGLNPQRLLAVIRKYYPETRVIAAVLRSKDGKLALDYGVDGYIRKGSTPEDFTASLLREFETLGSTEVKEG